MKLRSAEIRARLDSANWCRVECLNGASDAVPGVYEWRIEGGGVYVGHYTDAPRRRRDFVGNLRHLVNGAPYRPDKPADFRPIHDALLSALMDRKEITFAVLENHADRRTREQRQRELVAEHRARVAQGGPEVFNSEKRRTS